MENKILSPLNTGEMMVKRDQRGRILSGSVLNSAGKPKGVRHLSTLLLEKLSEAVKGASMAEEDIIIRKVIEMAKKGNMRAIELIWDRMEGKSLQTINQVSQVEPFTEEQEERLNSLLRIK